MDTRLPPAHGPVDPAGGLQQCRQQTRTHLKLSAAAFGGATPWLWFGQPSPGFAAVMALLCMGGGVVEFQRSRDAWRRFRSYQQQVRAPRRKEMAWPLIESS
jgi:hypothetical protein